MTWLRALLLLVPVLAGCAPRHPAPMEPAAAALAVTDHCVVMLVVDGDVEVTARVCTNSTWSCGRVRAAADRWGYLAGIVEVGVCIHEDGRGVETGP